MFITFLLRRLISFGLYMKYPRNIAVFQSRKFSIAKFAGTRYTYLHICRMEIDNLTELMIMNLTEKANTRDRTNEKRVL